MKRCNKCQRVHKYDKYRGPQEGADYHYYDCECGNTYVGPHPQYVFPIKLDAKLLSNVLKRD